MMPGALQSVIWWAWGRRRRIYGNGLLPFLLFFFLMLFFSLFLFQLWAPLCLLNSWAFIKLQTSNQFYDLGLPILNYLLLSSPSFYLFPLILELPWTISQVMTNSGGINLTRRWVRSHGSDEQSSSSICLKCLKQNCINHHHKCQKHYFIKLVRFYNYIEKKFRIKFCI